MGKYKIDVNEFMQNTLENDDYGMLNSSIYALDRTYIYNKNVKI